MCLLIKTHTDLPSGVYFRRIKAKVNQAKIWVHQKTYFCEVMLHNNRTSAQNHRTAKRPVVFWGGKWFVKNCLSLTFLLAFFDIIILFYLTLIVNLVYENKNPFIFIRSFVVCDSQRMFGWTSHSRQLRRFFLRTSSGSLNTMRKRPLILFILISS